VSSEKICVALVGPDPAGKGGMAAVMRDLLDSPLAERYRLETIVTWGGFQPASRLWAFCRGLVSLAIWCLRPGSRLVHIHSAVRGSLYRKSICVFLVRLLRRPVVVQVHGGPGDAEVFAARLGPIRRLFIRRGLSAASRVLAVSGESARTIERCFGVSGIGVIPNAAPAVPASRAGVAAEEPHVLYMGGFENPVKGGEALIAALELCADELGEVSFELGGPGDSSEELRSRLAGSSNVRWVGWLDRESKGEALERCSLFVLPSLSEGLPVALLEAMAWGRAIVATRVGGVPDVVADGVEARIVPPGDSQALADAIRGLMHDPAERQRLGQAARQRALSLNEDEVCGRLDTLYRELVR
jgi:glycosyltransferase involved in cell wall biosynthesis